MPRLLARADNSETSPPAPPQGLYFVRAAYPEALFNLDVPAAGAAALGMTASRLALRPPRVASLARPRRRRRRSARAQESVDQSRRTAIVTSAATGRPRSVVSVGVVGPPARAAVALRHVLRPRGHEQQVQSFGTGFVVRADGIIITNQHVVDGAERITVTLADGTDLPATLWARMPLTDIAVLRVDRQRPAGRAARHAAPTS